MQDKERFFANNFYYELNNQDEAIITGAKEWPEVLIIPEQLDGHTVVEIGASAFDTDIAMEKVKVSPEDGAPAEQLAMSYFDQMVLEKIQDRIKEVRLPETIRSIGVSAFYQCNSLRKINFPKSLRWIDSLAFANAWKLEAIRLPKGCELYSENTYAYEGDLAVFDEQGAFEGVRGFEDNESGDVPKDGIEIEYY